MQIPSALVWEIQGEPRREDVILSDEASAGLAGKLVVLQPDGRPRASKPADLPQGSLILVPPEVSAEEFAAINQSGYKARRSGPSDPSDEMVHTREAAIAAAEMELEEVVKRLKADLRGRHPELLDEDGRLRPAEYARQALRLTGGKRRLTREEILALGQSQADQEADSRPPNGA